MVEILRSGAAVAMVDPIDGGRLISLSLQGIELLGGDRPGLGLPTGWFHGCFPMVPYAGRLTNGQFIFDGITYAIPPNAGLDSGHGLVFDVPWSPDISLDPTHLVLVADLDARWPFGGRVEETFDLTEESLTISLTVKNDERVMPAALGFHPWFRRDIGTGGPATYFLRPGARYVPDMDGLPWVLCDDLGTRPWDDVFTQLEDAPVICWPNGPTIRITSNAQTWIVYERSQNAFCIEPITAPPNSLGTSKSAVVQPGVPLVLWMQFTWGLPEPQDRVVVRSQTARE